MNHKFWSHIIKGSILLFTVSLSCCTEYRTNYRYHECLVNKIICLYRSEIEQRENKEALWLCPPSYIRKALHGTTFEYLIEAKPADLIPTSGKKALQTTNLMIDLLNEAKKNKICIGWKGINMIDGSQIHVADHTAYSPSELFLCYFIQCAAESDEKNDYNLKLNGSTTLLMMAACMGSVELIEYLVKHGARLNDGTSERWCSDGGKGRTALHFAALANHKKAYNYLLQLGANPNIKDGYGKKACDYWIVD